MKLISIWLAAIVLLVAAITVIPSAAQDEDDPEATISALQTQVAEWETRYDSLRERYDRLRLEASLGTDDEPLPTPTPGQESGNDLGVEFSGDTWSITAVFTESRDVVGFEPPNQHQALGTYLIVYLDVVNHSNAEADFPWLALNVVDSQGREFGADLQATVGINIFELNKVDVYSMQPALEYVFPVVFDVPVDATGFTMTADESELSIVLGI